MKSLTFLKRHNKINTPVLSSLATDELTVVFKGHQFCNFNSIKVFVKTSPAFILKLMLVSTEQRKSSFAIFIALQRPVMAYFWHLWWSSKLNVFIRSLCLLLLLQRKKKNKSSLFTLLWGNQKKKAHITLRYLRCGCSVNKKIVCVKCRICLLFSQLVL